MKTQVKLLLPLTALVVFLAAWAYPPDSLFRAAHNDFLAFYCGARLSGTGHLYDAEATWNLQRELIGEVIPALLFIRLPFYAWLLQPLGQLPYHAAYWLYQSFALAALIGFVLLLGKRSPDVPYLCGLSMPLACSFGNGQDLAFLVFLVALGVWLASRGREYTAGLVFALLAIKIHLFWALPVGLVLQRRWRVLAGGATGGAVLLGISFAAEGWRWPEQYLAMVSRPGVHPETWVMGNLVGLLATLQAPGWLDGPLHLLVAALFVWLVRRDQGLDFVVGYALIAGLLTGRHSYGQDFALLLPAYALLCPRLPLAAHKVAFQFLLTPFLYFGLLYSPPYSALLPLALLAAFASFTLRRPPYNSQWVGSALPDLPHGSPRHS